MSSRIFVMPENLEWKQAYLAAILEKDRVRVLGLIDDARSKLAARLRELKEHDLVVGDEVEAIHDASYLLQALESSLSYRDELRRSRPEYNERQT